jgi:hypothetical protein
VLLTVQQHFHAVIRRRIDQQLPDHGLRLPELEPLLELDRPHMWFPVPGMYGGFSYPGWSQPGSRPSWCQRVGAVWSAVPGSGTR